MSAGGPPSRLRERLHWYKLDCYEFGVLSAMCLHDWYGKTIWASIPRLAAFAKLSERKVQYVIRALRKRGILSEFAPGNSANHRTVTYRINEEAFEADPRTAPYDERQIHLPGIQRPPVTGEPVTPGASHAPDPTTRRTPCGGLVHIVRGAGAYYAPDSLNESLLESKTTPKPPASAFQDFIESQFKEAGYETQREVAVPDRGDGSGGRIDLVARRGAEVVAVELDAGRPREKSQTKLLAYPATSRLIVLREPVAGFQHVPTFEAMILCSLCGGAKLLHQNPSVPGPRLVPCPKCATQPS
jgi:hypothetical protein